MRIELFKNLIKEETRLHSSLNNQKSFFSFPFILLFTTFVISSLLFVYSEINLDVTNLVFFSSGFFLITGIMSGIFGLTASDFLERRFGDMGTLFSNSLLLPIKLSDIFVVTALSDFVFYLGWFILPIILGFSAGLLVAGSSIFFVPLWILAVLFAFLLGILLSFFLTVLFTKSMKLFTFILVLISALGAFGFMYLGKIFFLPYYLFVDFSFLSLSINLLIIILLTYLCKITIGNEFSTKIVHTGKVKSFSFNNKINPFVFKDYIDLKRTHGIIAKPLFTVLIPSILLLFLLTSLNQLPFELGSVINNIVFFSVLVGTLSIGFMNTLLMGDSMAYYNFLPVSLKNFIKPKLILTSIICFILGLFMILGYVLINQVYTNILASAIMLLTLIIYANNINFYVNGLKPNETSLSAKNFLKIGMILLPVLLVSMVLPLLTTNIFYYLGFSLIALIFARIFFKKGLKKWLRITRA
ncbi:hypothetical protein [Candidatus Venteria ishoeyi]|uniref:Uncharacterized protein n=1 Tax=Candidatus Venteria ishoeyi TaxID=1899563 RepID=A0A1H6F7X6_9GAMM|nr:hypothetical protein [Candidatus Venteria ishoeyi]SEH05164.1 Uncharacterised protein [Candidatus Venteria ishoeyi]